MATLNGDRKMKISRAASFDGSAVVGTVEVGHRTMHGRWTKDKDIELLDQLPEEGWWLAEHNPLSSDGSVIVGYIRTALWF